MELKDATLFLLSYFFTEYKFMYAVVKINVKKTHTFKFYVQIYSYIV